MGKIDILDRRFFAGSDRFAELINMEIYHGEKVLAPGKLELLNRSYPSLMSASGEKERDILMYDFGQDICYGLEIETESDYSMPERIMVYDASEYECQIREIDREHRKSKAYESYREKKSRMKETDSLKPVITMVLYVGEGRWRGRKKLGELFRISQKAARHSGALFNDYGFPLMEADYIDAQNYHTDLREFFQAMQCRGDKERLEELVRLERFQKLSHETEVVISAHLNNHVLLRKVEEEGEPMCKALDDWIKEEKQNGRKEGRREGRRVGRKEGKQEERIRILRSLLLEGLDEQTIMRVTGCSRKEYAAAEGRINI